MDNIAAEAAAAPAAAAAAIFRLFLLSFFETDLTLGRSLMAVFGRTSDGAAIGVGAVYGGVAFGNCEEAALVVPVTLVDVGPLSRKYRNRLVCIMFGYAGARAYRMHGPLALPFDAVEFKSM